MTQIQRYLRLYLHFLRFSLSTAMEFRIDFFFRVIMDVVYYAVNIAFFKIVYSHTPMLASWNESQTMLFVSVFLLIDALHMTIFTNNLWSLPHMINTGDLDYYLTRPVSPLFFLSLRDFAFNSFLNVLVASGILVWAMGLNPESCTPFGVMLLLLLIANGVFLHYLTSLAFVIPVFWTHSGRGFSDAYHIFSRFIERPDRMFRGGLRLILTTILPLSLIASFPARLFLEPFDGAVLAQLLLVTAGFFTLVLWCWNRGLRVYASASS